MLYLRQPTATTKSFKLLCRETWVHSSSPDFPPGCLFLPLLSFCKQPHPNHSPISLCVFNSGTARFSPSMMHESENDMRTPTTVPVVALPWMSMEMLSAHAQITFCHFLLGCSPVPYSVLGSTALGVLSFESL